MLAREPSTPSVPDERAVLLALPSLSASERECCAAHLAPPGTRPHVLHVDFVRGPADRERQWEAHPTSPASLSMIRVRSPPPATGSSPPAGEVEVRDEVEEPADLLTVGMRVIDALEAWDDDRPAAVCLHSVTTLLQYVSPSATEQFLGELVDLTASHDARCHAHVEPGAHPATDLDALASPFDAAVSVDGVDRSPGE